MKNKQMKNKQMKNKHMKTKQMKTKQMKNKHMKTKQIHKSRFLVKSIKKNIKGTNSRYRSSSNKLYIKDIGTHPLYRLSSK